MILEGIKTLLGLNYGKTFAVGVPKDWVTHHNLKSKSQLHYLADEALVMFPKGARVDLDKIKEAIKPALADTKEEWICQ